MELWGRVQDVLRAPEVHQLVSQVEASMQDAISQVCSGHVPVCG